MTRAKVCTERRRTVLTAVALALIGLPLASCRAIGTARPAAVHKGQTVVSLEFDDGTASQWEARPLLSAHKLHATFFVVSGAVGTPGYLEWKQVEALRHDGHEIAGHTVTHPHLAALGADEARREICDGRRTLLRHGFHVTDFAYPYGSYTAGTKEMAASCGYNSARTIDEARAEAVRPADRYALTGAVLPTATTDLADLQRSITGAESHGGGWVHVVFHRLCSACDRFSTDPSTLAAFLDWLAPRHRSGTVVRTVSEVIGGPVRPAVPGPRAAPPVGLTNALPNASLEADADADGVPDCWSETGYGDAAATWARTPESHTGASAVRLDVSSLHAGDRKLLLTEDVGACSPTIAPGASYRVGAWYRASAAPVLVAFYRDADGRWTYWSESPPLTPGDRWTEASWTTPPAPRDAVGISVGLLLKSVGWLSVDDLTLVAVSP